MLYCFVLKIRAAVSTPMNALKSTSSLLEFYTVETRSLFDVFFRGLHSQLQSGRLDPLVKLVWFQHRIKAKKETEVQSPGCNVREGR